MKHFVVALTLSVLPVLAETNLLFLTVNGPFFDNPAKQIELAETNRESLPAEAFQEGNWGEKTNGLQLSRRFEKSFFTNGEPVVAILLLRNVSTNAISYNVAFTSDTDGPIGFTVHTDRGKASAMPRDHVNAFPRTADRPPGTQHKYVERLDARFSLRPGRYRVSARYGTFIRNAQRSSRPFEIRSSEVSIEIKE